MVLICEDKMKRLLLTTAFILFTSSAFAYGGCGPKVSLGISHNQNNGESNGQSTLKNYHNSGDNSKISLTMSWNLGEDYCTEQEYADLQKKKADEKRTLSYARREEVRELKELLALCAKYGADNPLLKGKCS